MDHDSEIDVDPSTNFPITLQGTHNSDISSVSWEHDTAHYIAVIVSTDRLLVYPVLGAERVELAAKVAYLILTVYELLRMQPDLVNC
jgi:hypothetical protein